ncbi:hypothetical protein [Bradyrhizobium japonicum]|uniref:hypothetical protein n=1 Tax=Bradyrhizobium japonicum TaxID=375 RepID=UPI001BAB966B|nr:hypothetical protein [Bradyrhizobium japonicum]MBR0960903.1 hypothetical protein [Bradyrhizobium japonicum]
MESEKGQEKKQIVSTVSAILDDGSIAELVYRSEDRKTLFAVYSAGRWTLKAGIDINSTTRLAPFSPENNLIKNAAVLLPSEPVIYGSDARLVSDIAAFIHRYVDLSPVFEKVATYYVLLSWLYDAFNELPYLRLRGDYGSGKTRALLTIGSICYKPFFASGASTVSPIFHTLNAFRGTLIFDEADFRFSDEKSELVKILNNGNVRGLPVLRTVMNRQREFNPEAFQVFGPKIVAARGSYEDRGLESRFLTEETGARKLRADIPINLPDSFQSEALELRNKLLLYRFHRLREVKLDESLIDRQLEPRMNQILLPLLSVVSDESLRAELRAMARDTQFGLVAERGLLVEAQVLEILNELMTACTRPVLPLKEVVEELWERYGEEYDRPITNRWVGSVLRKRLNIRTHKSHGVYVVPMSEREKIELLCHRYGVAVLVEETNG